VQFPGTDLRQADLAAARALQLAEAGGFAAAAGLNFTTPQTKNNKLFSKKLRPAGQFVYETESLNK